MRLPFRKSAPEEGDAPAAEEATAPATPDPPVDEAAEAPEGRTCPQCHAPMAEGQDWCLNCGHAAPGALGGGRPGAGAVAAVAALTLLLCGGAVAAAFAALNDEPPPAPIASVPAPVTPEPAPAPAAPTPAPPTTAPTDPSLTTPLPDPGTTDPLPDPGTSEPLPDPTPIAPLPPETDTGSSGGTTDQGSTTDEGTTTDPGTTTETTPAQPAPEPIEVTSVTVYDPYSRNTATDASASPERAADGDKGTSWRATVKDGSTQIAVGLLIQLPELEGVRVVELTTKTPGFGMEIYATDSEELPPTITDTRWAHIKDVADVGVADDGTERVVLGAGTSKYRTVLLWFTTPPPDGLTVGVSEVTLLG